jgi:hypothetical protein
MSCNVYERRAVPCRWTRRSRWPLKKRTEVRFSTWRPRNKRKTPTCEGARRASSILPRLRYYPFPTAEKREGSPKPKVSASESKSVAAPRHEAVDDGVPSDSPRFGYAPVGKPIPALGDAEGGNGCVCPVDAATPVRLMETSGTSRIPSAPSTLVHLLADDSPVNRDRHHELPLGS